MLFVVKSLVEVSSIKWQWTEADESRRSASFYSYLVTDGRRFQLSAHFLVNLGNKALVFLNLIGRKWKSPEKAERVRVRKQDQD